ncbi:hypothetical protein NQ318_007051 [Aromia moschata]|uniref:Uncharacterized protein n=1 Tax=Aromia moschata TaxID=1265417 RepID=A0AAV8XI92_9CUCU|nr:hypothetical protein NQ318_007051 [Aromia moschata]
MSETSTQNQRRVAEWIQTNMENDENSPENSRAESTKNKVDVGVDKVRYAEMEENVKRFLFGESEFLKTVELGKIKYQNFRVGSDGPSRGGNT